MAKSFQDNFPTCEQCGTSLAGASPDEGCLNCLLGTGLEAGSSDIITVPKSASDREFQHYEILTHPNGSLWEIGRSAVGYSYKARDINLDVPVVLKVARARFLGGPQERRLFLSEARTAAQLRHANVPAVLHFGTTKAENGEEDCFYAVEYVEGESLEASLRRNGPMAPATALNLGLQVGRALAAAEKIGLVHDALTPCNIILETDGDAAAKVINFGPSKLMEEEIPGESLVKTRTFASPEESEGRERSTRSNIYSLGKVLCYSLTGQILDRVSDQALLLVQLQQRKVSERAITLLTSMLAVRPDHRPSPMEVVRVLQGCLKEPGSAEIAGVRPLASRARCWAWAGGLGLITAIVCLVLWFIGRPPLPEKSVAVLPFRNLSAEPGNAFFAEGIQDDIQSRLLKIRDLKVISRLATARYPANAPRDLRAIGKALGVRHVLEGSLRRDGNRIRMHVALVDTQSGVEVLSEAFDRDLKDAMRLQGALANQIASALKVNLSAEERVNLLSQTTRNPDAYVLYLRARKLENNPAYFISAFEGAEALYRQAVAIDPQFALAHARLATNLGLLYRFRGPSEDLRNEAHAEVREALRLQPDLGEGYLAKGLCDYWIERDFERAIVELEVAEKLMPNDTEGTMTIAFIRRRQGQWKEALAAQVRASTREPLNVEYEHELNATAILTRDWSTAATHITKAVALAPKVAALRGEAAAVKFWQTGVLAPLQRFFAEFDSYGDPGGVLAWGRWDCAMMARDFPLARAAIETFPHDTLPSVIGAPVPKAYLEGCTRLAQGEKKKAQERFEAARPSMEAEALSHSDDALRHARLGLLYAYMGRKADAVREAERAVEITPVSKDAIDGHQWLCHLALVRAWVGDKDEAINMIERLLREPGCVSPVNEASMTLWELRLRWQWDPLRKSARFQKLLAGSEPQTIL
ncbi:MAG: protein kinase domain-containing protein [Chthoniobacterales bacterium]